jgi:hypothetical protein
MKRLPFIAAVLALAAGAADIPFEVMENAFPFVLRNSATPQKHQIETMPGGVALFDYDDDGRLDVFFANGAPQPSLVKTGPEYSNRLYRNLGNLRFEDVTGRAGLSGEGYAMGTAAGDYDNDGRIDLLVTRHGGSTLYRNRGDGSFEDVTRAAQIPQTEWPLSAGWFDMDNDGDLDLFLVNYCRWNPRTEPFCGDARAGYRTYCHPKHYPPLANTLARNNGDGTFTDISVEAGIAAKNGKGMSVNFADYDGDGLTDIFVTNDTVPNSLFRNLGGGRFAETALEAGVAMTDEGAALSSMGSDFRDLDNDGRPDLFIAALANETFPLFRNLGKGVFKEQTQIAGIAVATLPLGGWSAGVFDFNNDGWKDLFTANSDVNDNTEVFSSRKSRLPSHLFLSRQGRRYALMPVGPPSHYRGAAFGDLDGDGRVDAVLTRLNQSPVLLRNTSGTDNHWLALRLKGTRSNRDGLGAVVRVEAGGQSQWNHATTSVGYLCSSDRVVHFGLGPAARADRIEIVWPGGRRQVLQNVDANQRVTVTEP